MKERIIFEFKFHVIFIFCGNFLEAVLQSREMVVMVQLVIFFFYDPWDRTAVFRFLGPIFEHKKMKMKIDFSFLRFPGFSMVE